MTLSTKNASISGKTVRAMYANPARPVVVAGEGAMGVRTVIQQNEDRFTVERWITMDGKVIASCGQTYYANITRALRVAAAWIAATVDASAA